MQKPLRITKGNNYNSNGPWPLFFISSLFLEDRNVFAKFDEIPSMNLLKDIMETVYTKAIENYKGK